MSQKLKRALSALLCLMLILSTVNTTVLAAVSDSDVSVQQIVTSSDKTEESKQ